MDATTGQTYEGVLICNSPDFKVNWYVGSSETAIKLYDYQWDGNIFTLEEVGVPTGVKGQGSMVKGQGAMVKGLVIKKI